MWPLTVGGAELFGLLLVRCMGFYVAGPIFAQRNLPAQVKILLGVTTAIALFTMASQTPVSPPADLAGFALAVAGETFMGIVLAFGASLPFVGIRLAGSLMGMQMGFGIVNVMGARGGEQHVPIIARFYDILAVTLFLLLDGHHLLLQALGTSLRLIPLGGVAFSAGLAGQLVAMAGSVFVTAMSVGGPIIAVLFLADAAMGFVARTVPQMNIFIVGFPIKIGLGLLGISLTIPHFFRTVQGLTTGLERDLLALLSGM
ncbi:MAG: flagellar biosynthetic protein FliR [Candidatus Eisenbacteria sp.]|nr:flagellar biosynthetic protein FliR [Candidatus Eisenbacteria bacterium]